MNTQAITECLLALLRAKASTVENRHLKEDSQWSFKDYLELYKTFREYVIVESGLTNTRLGWLLTVNGFLFTGFGLGLQSALTTAHDHASDVLKSGLPMGSSKLSQLNLTFEHARTLQHGFMLVLCIAGAWLCLSVYRAILAARAASKSATDLFERVGNLPHELNPDTYQHRRWWFAGERHTYRAPGGVYLPHIRGGGLLWTVNAGSGAANGIAFVLILIWVVLAAATGFTLFSPDW